MPSSVENKPALVNVPWRLHQSVMLRTSKKGDERQQTGAIFVAVPSQKMIATLLRMKQAIP